VTDSFKKPRIFPLAWLVIALIALFCLHRWLPIATWIPTPFNRAGIVLTVPGLAIILYSGASFLKAKTGLLPFSQPTQLVTDGLYRFTRNPMYLGMVMLLLGLAVWLGSLSAFFPVVLFAWIIDHQFIRNEELFLLEVFGDEYRAYQRKVRRWI
jgi:protein-S-isoprenylcysteine O-methyltransferase Ste14